MQWCDNSAGCNSSHARLRYLIAFYVILCCRCVGRAVPSGVIIALDLTATGAGEGFTLWPQFHNGVAAGTTKDNQKLEQSLSRDSHDGLI